LLLTYRRASGGDFEKLLVGCKTHCGKPTAGAQRGATDSTYVTSRDTIFYWVNTWASAARGSVTGDPGGRTEGLLRER